MSSFNKKYYIIFLLGVTFSVVGIGVMFFPSTAQAMCPCSATYVQDEYWFLDDESGNQNAVTGWGVGDTAASTNITGVAKSTIFRLRMEIQETGGNDQDSAFLTQLEYSSNATSCTSGTWVKITGASSDVQYSTSSNFTSPVATTERLNGNEPKGPTFQAGEIVDDRNPTADKGFLTDEDTEDEWALVFTTSATDGATYRFRTTDNGTTLNTYPVDCPQATVAAGAVIALVVEDGTVTYGNMDLNTSKSTLSGELNDQQDAANTGNTTEIFNIQGQNSGCPWTLSGAAGNNNYVHEFSTNTGTDWFALQTTYQELNPSVAQDATQSFDLRITTPTNTACFNQQSVDVTVQAIQG